MKIKAALMGMLLSQMGISEERQDAGETAFFTRQLETILAKTYDVIYPEFKARLFIPVSNEVDPGAESFTYRQFDQFGIAIILANYADDLPVVDVFGKEFTAPVRGMGAAYHFTVQDLRKSAMAGTDLDGKKAKAARRAIETLIDQIAATGNSAAGLKGFVNHASVPLVTPITGAWSNSTTAQQILDDLNKLVNSIIILTKEAIIPDTVILDNTSFQIAASKRVDTTNNKSVLVSFLENSPYIKNIDQWHRLNLANAAGNGRRIICYKRDAEILELIIPQEFEQFPPQAKNLQFIIPCHARIGGLSIRYPMGVAYMDLE